MKTMRSQSPWHAPVPEEYFIVTQPYLNEDKTLYPKFGHHSGVDYGARGAVDIPIFACADGTVVYSAAADSPWGASLGNHLALYVPRVRRSFLYCHLADVPHISGTVRAGDVLGAMGNTGASAGGAIHLHLEGFRGRFDISMRAFVSLDYIKKKTFDADAYIRKHL